MSARVHIYAQGFTQAHHQFVEIKLTCVLLNVNRCQDIYNWATTTSLICLQNLEQLRLERISWFTRISSSHSQSLLVPSKLVAAYYCTTTRSQVCPPRFGQFKSMVSSGWIKICYPRFRHQQVRMHGLEIWFWATIGWRISQPIFSSSNSLEIWICLRIGLCNCHQWTSVPSMVRWVWIKTA